MTDKNKRPPSPSEVIEENTRTGDFSDPRRPRPLDVSDTLPPPPPPEKGGNHESGATE